MIQRQLRSAEENDTLRTDVTQAPAHAGGHTVTRSAAVGEGASQPLLK